MKLRSLGLALALAMTGCGSSSEPSGYRLVFEPSIKLDHPGAFFDQPFPSDLRLSADGAPDVTGYPNPSNNLTTPLVATAAQRKGFPVVPVAYFKFTGQPAIQDPEHIIPAALTSPVLLMDVDPSSAERGHLMPTVAETAIPDDYVPDFLLAVAPRPGFVLLPHHKYAFVVLTSLDDDQGRPLAPMHLPFATGTPAAAIFAPLLETLAQQKVAQSSVAAATVFTTGDVVADLFDLSTKVIARDHVTIEGLHVDPDDGATHDGFCELIGTVSYPQFQRGTPPFDSDGLFVPGSDGLPITQRMETAPMTITLPNVVMPDAGYPLMIYFHGSGGLSSAVVDEGRSPAFGVDGPKGTGPAFVVSPTGLATAGSALPVNPERLPGASDYEYLNIMNPAAMRDTFRQGIIEQRMFLEALRTLTIPPATLGACTGPSLPASATAYKFAPDRLVASGQSMGAMYTNLVSAVEPRIKAVVPTGAGGFWSYFITKTNLITNVDGSIGLLFGIPRGPSFLHPTLSLFELASEAIDPMVSMPRLAKRPLPSHPARPIYEPIGKDDKYFPTVLYDAIVLAYGHKETGEVVWPTLQDALLLDGRGGLLPYPVKDNNLSETGAHYTGAAAQYLGDGIYDSHQIYRQLESVKFQYRCFLKTFLDTGSAVIFAPKTLADPCPAP